MWYLAGFVVLVLLFGFWPTVILIVGSISAFMVWYRWNDIACKYLEWQWERDGAVWEDRPERLKKRDADRAFADGFGARLNRGLDDGSITFDPVAYDLNIHGKSSDTPEKPGKLAGAAAFAAGAAIGSHLVSAREREKEAKRIARNIEYHVHMMRQDRTDFSQRFHQDEITKLQAKLAALQVR